MNAYALMVAYGDKKEHCHSFFLKEQEALQTQQDQLRLFGDKIKTRVILADVVVDKDGNPIEVKEM